MHAVLLLLLITSVARTDAAPSVQQLSWLAGQWCGENRDVYNEETWLAPRAGSMLGMHRDTRAGASNGFEFFRIVEDGDALAYRSQPGGAPVTEFRARAVGARSVDFLNPKHDYPKRIRYWLDDAERLHARIDDGTDADAGTTWVWTRDCAAP